MIVHLILMTQPCTVSSAHDSDYPARQRHGENIRHMKYLIRGRRYARDCGKCAILEG